MNDLQKQLQIVSQFQRESELRRKREDTIEVLIRIMSASYDKSVSYTRLFMIGGYASFFAVWAKVYDMFSAFYMGLAGILMFLSVLVFIVWELYKMIFYATNLKALYKVLEEKDPEKFNKNLEHHQMAEKRKSLEQVKIWWLVLIVTVFPALGAAGILICSFCKYLFDSMM
jgi:hypothetical protein